MLTDPVRPPVNVAEQLPADRVHEVVDGVTDPNPNCEKVTWPVGEVPVTVAVHETVAPTRTEAGEQVNDVPEVVWVTEMSNTPELPRFTTSPW